MATVYTWTVDWIKTYPTAEGQTNVVCEAGWRCSGVYDAGGDVQYRSSANSSCTFTYTSGDPFTPYDQLTQDQVLGWIWGSNVDQTAVEAVVEEKIQDQINPTEVYSPLPWTDESAA